MMSYFLDCFENNIIECDYNIRHNQTHCLVTEPDGIKDGASRGK